MVKAVIFDMDGVIVDSEPLALKQYTLVLKNLGYEIEEDFLHTLQGVTQRKYWETVKAHLSLAQNIEDLMRNQQAHMIAYWKSLPHLEANRGIPELLDMIRKAGIRVALATSASSQRVPIFLERLGLSDAFEVVVNGEDIKHSKPAPDTYLLAAQKLKVDPVECVAIEDAKNGVESAKSAGMKVIGYKVPHNKQDLAAADLIIHDFGTITENVLSAL